MSEADGSTHNPGPISTQMAEALFVRISQVETQQESAKRTTTMLAIGLAIAVAFGTAGLLFGLASGRGAVLEAEEVVLVDANGVLRGRWAIQEDGSTTLQLLDQNSMARVRVSVLDNGAPGLILSDGRGRSRIALALLPDEGGTLAFADAEGSTRAVLGLAPDNAATLVFVDGFGSTRAGIGMDSDGEPNLTLFESERRSSARDSTSSQ